METIWPVINRKASLRAGCWERADILQLKDMPPFNPKVAEGSVSALPEIKKRTFLKFAGTLLVSYSRIIRVPLFRETSILPQIPKDQAVTAAFFGTGGTWPLRDSFGLQTLAYGFPSTCWFFVRNAGEIPRYTPYGD